MWRAAAAAVHQANAPWWGSAVRGLLRRRWLALRAVVVRARFFFMNKDPAVHSGHCSYEYSSHGASWVRKSQLKCVCRWLTLKFQVHFSAVVMMLATQL